MSCLPRNRILGHTRIQRLFKRTMARYGYCKTVISPRTGHTFARGLHIRYLNVAFYSGLPDCVLIDFFCEGVNQPLKSMIIHKGPRLSLSQFLDYALMTVGSAFTVGVAEERDTALARVMTVAPEHAHKMAATAEIDRKMADTTASCSVTAANPELSQVTAELSRAKSSHR